MKCCTKCGQELPFSMKAARVKVGMSQVDLSKASGLSQSQVCRLEAGKGSPRMAHAYALAKVLKVPAEKLFPES